MNGSTERLLAAVLDAAGRKIAEAEQHGQLLWKTGDTRCYRAQRDGTGVLTLVFAGRPDFTQYQIVGVDLQHLL